MNAKFVSAPYRAWRPVLVRVLADPSSVADAACPTCGEKTLHLLFAGDVEERIGFATLWCTTSGDGVISGRMRIPARQEMVPWDEHSRRITPFTVIAPDFDEPPDDVFDPSSPA